MVFAGIFPTATDDSGFEGLQYAMNKFLLQDGSVTVENEQSKSLGRGLRCGFLGMLHMEVSSCASTWTWPCAAAGSLGCCTWR